MKKTIAFVCSDSIYYRSFINSIKRTKDYDYVMVLTEEDTLGRIFDLYILHKSCNDLKLITSVINKTR